MSAKAIIRKKKASVAASKTKEADQKRRNKLNSLKNEFEGGKIRTFDQVFAIYDYSPLGQDLKIPFYTFLKKIEDPGEFKVNEIECFARLINVDYELIHRFVKSLAKQVRK